MASTTDAHNAAPHSYAEAAAEPPQNPELVVAGPEDKKPPVKKVTVNGYVTPPTEYEGVGKDDAPRSPTRRANGHRRKASTDTDSTSTKRKSEDNENNIIFKNFGNGGQLTSVKPADGYEDQNRVDKKQKKEVNSTELTSGREAGQGWHRSKVRFAPLNVPLKRRLQTFVVLLHTLSIVGLVTIFFLLCAIPIFWPILFPYLIYVLFSKAGTSGELSLRSDWFRRLPIWSLFASYFPARLHRVEELPPTRKYIFGYHPHGIISHGAFAAFATEALGFSQLFPGITNSLLTLDNNFRLPLYREYALRLGLCSVSKESCENILSKGGPNNEGMGRGITIVIGGAQESLDAQPGSLRLVLKKRKGFVKIAIRQGADLVPVLGFGENELYDQFDAAAHPWIHKFQILVKKVAGFTVPLFHARGVFNYDVGMMPYRRPMNIVVGRPIRIMQQSNPDPKYVDEVHQRYIEGLKQVWEDWKDTFAKERKAEMEIVE